MTTIELFKSISNQLSELENVMKKEHEDMTRHLSNKIDILTTENTGLVQLNAILLEDKTKLETQLKTLEEEHKNFTRVSKLISMENDIYRLRQENDLLKSQLQEMKEKQPPPTEESGVEVREKRIGGNIFYIDDKNNVYVKNDDDTVGEKVGKIEKDNGKQKVLWI
jgi:hypothetical protein